MKSAAESVSVVDFTTGMAGLLDTIDTDVRLLTDRAQLDLVADLLRIQSRLAGVLHTVLGVVDRAEAAQTAYGVPLTSWLAGELADEAVVDAMAANFASLAKAWREAVGAGRRS